jgi:hypothetical protein
MPRYTNDRPCWSTAMQKVPAVQDTPVNPLRP